MEYNLPSELVKTLHFDEDARSKIIAGINKLGKAVSSTMGASGHCVVYEDGMGKPNITKDGVTVAESVVLKDPVENIGATLIKQAAKNTVKEAGDGTSASIVLSMALLEALEENRSLGVRELKDGLESGLIKINEYLDSIKIDVTKEMLTDVASISCNNDRVLGKVIGDAFAKVGKDGVVMIEDSPTNETYADVIDGVQVNSKLKSPYFITDKGREVAELENPYVLILESPLANIRKIKIILEEIQRTSRPLLIIGDVEDQPLKVLMANKLKGNIKVNVIDPPSLRSIRQDTLEDLSIITGAKVINESLGDDIDLITLDLLGEVDKCVTDSKKTVLITSNENDKLSERIDFVKSKLKEDKSGYAQKKLRERLAMLAGKVGVIYVGADSDVELKEKKDRVDDAVHATKAAYEGGIVSGGGVALKDAVTVLDVNNAGENVLAKSIMHPFFTIIDNAGYLDINHLRSVGASKMNWLEAMWSKITGNSWKLNMEQGYGINALDGEKVCMIDEKIIDPLNVVKSSLKNAVSVVSTIVSANCVVSNERLEE